jgi:hypothetical protein
MPLYIRKRIKIAPGLALNVSKSGLGLSASVKGFRVSTGPRGTQINAGRGGLYYRKSLNGGRRRQQTAGVPLVPGYDVQATLSVRDANGQISARPIDPTTITEADLAQMNVVVLDERTYRRQVNAATLLYFCGWVPGVVANWRLREEMRAFRRQYGVKPPWMGVVTFEFWAFTVVPLTIIALGLIGAVL